MSPKASSPSPSPPSALLLYVLTPDDVPSLIFLFLEIGSESHFKVVVVSDEFEGMKLIERHRSINSLLEDELQGANPNPNPNSNPDTNPNLPASY